MGSEDPGSPRIPLQRSQLVEVRPEEEDRVSAPPLKDRRHDGAASPRGLFDQPIHDGRWNGRQVAQGHQDGFGLRSRQQPAGQRAGHPRPPVGIVHQSDPVSGWQAQALQDPLPLAPQHQDDRVHPRGQQVVQGVLKQGPSLQGQQLLAAPHAASRTSSQQQCSRLHPNTSRSPSAWLSTRSTRSRNRLARSRRRSCGTERAWLRTRIRLPGGRRAR